MAEYAVVNKTQLDADMTSVADTIRTKGGTSEKLSWPNGYKAAVEAIQTGGGAPVEVDEKDVNFYDYDGTLLYSYTLAEAQALTELPPGPEHEGLVFQQWNWTLEQVKGLKYPMDIGALYTTDDGWSRFYLDVPMEMDITLYFWAPLFKNITVDWGDGSGTEGAKTSGYNSLPHTYTPGKYVLRVRDPDNNVVFGNAGGPRNMFDKTGSPISNILRKAEIAYGSSLGPAFRNCENLETISLSNTCDTGRNCFSGCGRLGAAIIPTAESTLGISLFEDTCTKIISLPPTIVSANTQCWRNTKGVNKVRLPEGLTSIDSRSFENAKSINEVIVPSTVTSIGANTFLNCSGLWRIRFCSETPPSVDNANAFSGVDKSCIIEVPAGCMEAYTTATNYPSADTYTYVEASE